MYSLLPKVFLQKFLVLVFFLIEESNRVGEKLKFSVRKGNLPSAIKQVTEVEEKAHGMT